MILSNDINKHINPIELASSPFEIIVVVFILIISILVSFTLLIKHYI
ncbi:MAG: hypothetical protein CENE_02818 [Candidatus Celerinatantimonas neptuna]|nr:MAG: hypothetical protein CENE_02818 [Candidatus Celerinatantimonas neptuna]